MKNRCGKCPTCVRSWNRCVSPPAGCGGPATQFEDEASRREYTISGLCQKCQNEVFG